MSATVKVGAHGRNAGWWKIRDAIADGANFTNSNGSFRGERAEQAPTSAGQLPAQYAAQFYSAQVDYVIYSYRTPIAWHVRGAQGVGGTWYVPDTRYSVTTSRHQSQAHVAVAEQPSSSDYYGPVIHN